MKTILYIMYSMFFILGSCAVQKKSITYTQATFRVEGNCDMCKNRIEHAVLSLAGVKTANWNVSTKMLDISYNSAKMNEDKIHQELSNIGHATSKMPADEKAYQTLHSCCKYKD